jgi:hypothetical protein
MSHPPGATRATHLPLAVLLVAGGIVLAGCGGRSSGSTAQTVSSAPAQASTAAASSAPANTSTPAVNVGASFCKYAKTEKSQVADEMKAFSIDSPAQLEAFEQRALSDVTALVATAPASVRSAVKIVVTTDQSFFDQLKAAHFDYRKLNPTTVAKVDTPAFVQATHTIVNYFQHACGVASSSPPAG